MCEGKAGIMIEGGVKQKSILVSATCLKACIHDLFFRRKNLFSFFYFTFYMPLLQLSWYNVGLQR